MGKTEIRKRAQPIGIRVTFSTGSEVVTGLGGTCPMRPFASIFQEAHARPWREMRTGALSGVNGRAAIVPTALAILDMTIPKFGEEDGC